MVRATSAIVPVQLKSISVSVKHPPGDKTGSQIEDEKDILPLLASARLRSSWSAAVSSWRNRRPSITFSDDGSSIYK